MRLERWRVVRGQPPSRQGEGIEVPDFVQVGTGPAPATFGLDHDGENLFQTVQHAGQPSVITWIRTAGGEVHKRFNPLIESMPVQGLSVAPRPGSLLLAYRPSESDVTVPPGLCNPTSETFEPLIPDEAARRAWLKLIFPVLESQVEKSLSGVAPAEAAGWKDRRPTRLPIPGELDAEDPNRLRIVRLAKLGQSVARRDVPEGPDSAARAPRDGWAELILDDLAGDYENALAWLDRLETSVEGREARTRLLGLRAQMSLGMRKVDRAGPIVDYLRVVEGEELAAINSKLSDITNPTLSWVARLQEYVNKKETDDSISDSQDLRGRISVPRGADVINQELPPRP
jgi:hypothetical protein